ncbi:Putative adhesin [Lachnospiraceae bacterium NE2001]|nr:Putative adhesin [Lachnospiraceae bacterium NE2001]
MKTNKKFIKSLVGTMFIASISLISLTGCSFGFSYTYANANKYEAGDQTFVEDIDTINIDYLSGDVKLTSGSKSKIFVKETANKNLDERHMVHTWVDGSTLYVKYCESTSNINFNNIDKELEVIIPEDLKLEDLKVEVSSADTDIQCSAKNIEIEASSGDVTLTQSGDSDCIAIDTSSGKINATVENVETMKNEASSGNIKVAGDFIKDLTSSTSSGNAEYSLKTAPESSDISASSGTVNVNVPADSDLKASFDVSSGEISYELPFTKDDNSYVCGKGTNKMSIETSSGDININKLDN